MRIFGVIFFLLSALFIRANGQQKVTTLPLSITVLTSGLSELISLDGLKRSLIEILSFHSPQTPKGPLVDVVFQMRYEVIRATDEFLLAYTAALKSKPENENGIRFIHVSEVESILSTAEDRVSHSLFNIPFFIFHSTTLPRHAIYSQSERECSQSVVGKVAFMDLSAEICDDLSKAMSRQTDEAKVRWSTPSVSAPLPFVFPGKDIPSSSRDLDSAQKRSLLEARLAGVVVSGIETFASSSIQWRVSHSTDKIFCPVVIFRNSGLSNELTGTVTRFNTVVDEDIDDIEALSEVNSLSNSTRRIRLHIPKHSSHVEPNLPVIQRWLQSLLLPQQELVMLTTTHYVDEHPQVGVAVASSLRTFASVTSSQDPLGVIDPESRATSAPLTESIPYLDSAKFLRELQAASGDALCTHLLSNAGHGDSISLAMKIESAEALFSVGVARADIMDWMLEDEEYSHIPAASAAARTKPIVFQSSSKIGGGQRSGGGGGYKDDKRRAARSETSGGSRAKSRRSVAIVPMFILSDLHMHMQRIKSPNASVDDSDLPVQPLLDRHSLYAVQGDAVLALHSSSELVKTFSPVTKTWRRSNISSLDATIAAGLSRALAGLSAPHSSGVDNRGGVFDLTWTHGVHPFLPFGAFSDADLVSLEGKRREREGGRGVGGGGNATAFSSDVKGVLAWSSRRGSLIARVHAALQRADKATQRAGLLVQEVVEAILILDGSSSSGSSVGGGSAPAKTPSPAGGKQSDDPDNEAASDGSETGTIEDLMRPAGRFMSNSKLAEVIPDLLTDELVAIEDDEFDLKLAVIGILDALSPGRSGGFNDNKNGVVSGQVSAAAPHVSPQRFEYIVKLLVELEEKISVIEKRLVISEVNLQGQLAKCWITFHENPRATEQRMHQMMSSNAHNFIMWEMFRAGVQRFKIAIAVVVLSGAVGLLYLLRFIQRRLEESAKKLR